MKKFKVGDRVRFIDKETADGKLFNRLATIVTIDKVDGLISIEFDERSSWLHDCEGYTDYNKGWYAEPCEIELFNWKANDKAIDINSNRPITIIKIDKDNMVFVSDDSYHTYWIDIKDLDEYKEPMYPSIYIHRVGCGRTIKACYMIDGKVIRKAKATCHKDDEFDYKVGATLAMERLFEKLEKDKIENNQVEKGDIVKVKDSCYNRIYTHYLEWFDKYDIATPLRTRYSYDGDIAKTINWEGNEFRVLCIAPHTTCNKDLLCLISSGADDGYKYGAIFLIDIDALEKITDF